MRPVTTTQLQDTVSVPVRFGALLSCLLAVATLVFATDNPPSKALKEIADSDLYVKLQLANTIKVSKLKTGDVVDGKLSQDVYSGDRELFPAGSPVRLTVDKLERVRRVPNDHWPWVVKFFTPRHQNSPTFQAASVTLANGKEIPLRVSLISISNERQVHAQIKNPSTKSLVPNEGPSSPIPPTAKSTPGVPVVTLEATELATAEAASSGENAPTPFSFSGPITLAAGTQARIILLGNVSASKSRPGDSFQARLVEPVRLDSQVVLPEGSLFGGTVVKSTRPRMLSRAGSLLLAFTSLTLPGGAAAPIEASVTGAILDQRSHTKIDPEGKLHGDHPGKAWMLIDAGVTAGIAKEADDTLQLIIEAFVSTATDASTAGVGRIAASSASALFLLTRHGRDVILPKFTQMNIMFDRPVSLTGPQSAPGAP